MAEHCARCTHAFGLHDGSRGCRAWLFDNTVCDCNGFTQVVAPTGRSAPSAGADRDLEEVAQRWLDAGASHHEDVNLERALRRWLASRGVGQGDG